MPKKKAAKAEEKPELLTSFETQRARTACLCPRLGDAFRRSDFVEKIREEVVEHRINKSIIKHGAELRLDHSSLSTLEFLSCTQDLQHIQHLNLANNNLYDIRELFSTISSLKTLTILDLSHNYLFEPLPRSCFELSLLEEFRCDDNRLTSFIEDGPEAESGGQYWPQLRVLSLSYNLLPSLSSVVSSFTGLQYLNLKHNSLTCLFDVETKSRMDLNQSIEGKAWGRHIKRLNLSYNLIIDVPPSEIGLLTAIEELDLSYNKISQLPHILFTRAGSMKKLFVGNNQLVDFAGELCVSMPLLQDLFIHKNKLEYLPQEISHMVHLKRLSVSGNNLKTFPDEISSCLLLEEIYVANNPKFTSIPSSAASLINVREFQASKCPQFKQLPSFVASDWTMLAELDVRGLKKQVCKMNPDMMDLFAGRECIVRGGVVKGKRSTKKKT